MTHYINHITTMNIKQLQHNLLLIVPIIAPSPFLWTNLLYFMVSKIIAQHHKWSFYL